MDILSNTGKDNQKDRYLAIKRQNETEHQNIAPIKKRYEDITSNYSYDLLEVEQRRNFEEGYKDLLGLYDFLQDQHEQWKIRQDTEQSRQETADKMSDKSIGELFRINTAFWVLRESALLNEMEKAIASIPPYEKMVRHPDYPLLPWELRSKYEDIQNIQEAFRIGGKIASTVYGSDKSISCFNPVIVQMDHGMAETMRSGMKKEKATENFTEISMGEVRESAKLSEKYKEYQPSVRKWLNKQRKEWADLNKEFHESLCFFHRLMSERGSPRWWHQMMSKYIARDQRNLGDKVKVYFELADETFREHRKNQDMDRARQIVSKMGNYEKEFMKMIYPSRLANIELVSGQKFGVDTKLHNLQKEERNSDIKAKLGELEQAFLRREKAAFRSLDDEQGEQALTAYQQAIKALRGYLQEMQLYRSLLFNVHTIQGAIDHINNL